MGTVVILQRGRYMEEIAAPKYRPFHRRYNETFANRVRMDAERNSNQVCREKPRRESDWLGVCFL